MSVFLGVGSCGTLSERAGEIGVPVYPSDIERWVGMLPKTMREMLARGPVNEFEEHALPCCRVCRIIRVMDGRGQRNAGLDFLHLWHAQDYTAPEELMEDTASYLRCLYVYLVAGWDGVHGEGPLVCLVCESCDRVWPIDSLEPGEPCDKCGGFVLIGEFESHEAKVPEWAA